MRRSKRAEKTGTAEQRQRQLQRGRRSVEALTQCATLGAEQVIAQRRPRQSVLHAVVLSALPSLSLLILLAVLVMTFVSLPPLELVLVLVLVLMLVLLLLLTLL